MTYQFLPAEGEGLHQIAVGPVHAGIIEPGHFRFTANGEHVVRLEQRLGYVHKGIDRLTQGATLEQAAKLAGRASGELTRLLGTDDPVRGIRVLVETGLMEEFLPEVSALRLEVEGELEQVERAFRMRLVRSHDHAPVLGDVEEAVAPPLDVIEELGGVDGPALRFGRRDWVVGSGGGHQRSKPIHAARRAR